MDILKYENKDYSNDIVYHLKQFRADLLRLQINYNRNFILCRSINIFIEKIDLIESLVQEEPKLDMMFVYNSMIPYLKRDNQLTGAQLNLIWFPENKTNMVSLDFHINKPKLESDGLS